MTIIAGGILTWSGAEWAINLGLIFGAVAVGMGTILSAIYPWIKRIAGDVVKAKIDIQSASTAAAVAKALAEQQQSLLATTATTAARADATSNVNSAAVRNIRNDLTAVAISVPSTEQIANAVSAVVSPTPTLTSPAVPPSPESLLS